MTQFKGKQFQKDVIIVAVGYYLRYNLSYREVQEILYDRGIHVCHHNLPLGARIRKDSLSNLEKEKQTVLLFMENGRDLYQN